MHVQGTFKNHRDIGLYKGRMAIEIVYGRADLGIRPIMALPPPLLLVSPNHYSLPTAMLCNDSQPGGPRR
jgi:hypothetical protein